tara:strand:- start:911 stop:1486 length:576 start_codon:yes stop_codon:yes gene_type:complete
MSIDISVNNKQWMQAIAEQKHLYLGNIGDPKFSLYQMIKLIPHHNKDDIIFDEDRERFLLSNCHKRGRVPKNIIAIVKDLQKIFNQNKVTLDIYASFYEDLGRASIHKDLASVIYLQSVGEVDWSVWESDEPEGVVIDPDKSTCLFDRRLVPGDMMYMPRHKAHRSMPVGHARLGLSFAADGGVDPSSYIK